MTQREALPLVKIYTDGGCRGNPGLGGWGVVLQSGRHRKELKGVEFETTNNRMELTAAIKALETLNKPCKVELWTDSIYVKNGITTWLAQWVKQNWRTAAKKPVKNQDLWQQLAAATQAHQIQWHWIKGHAGHAGNERADALANAAMDAAQARLLKE